MQIDIAIPTHNRAAELAQTLTSLQTMRAPSSWEWRIVVVDNKCMDNTAAVVNRFTEAFGGRLVRIIENKPGLCYARNAAVMHSQADIVAFIDDDVDVEPQWLVALCQAFEEEQCDVVGGRAELRFPGEKPSWIGPDEEGFLSRVDRGPVRRLCKYDEIFGLNFAFKRSWVNQVGTFRSDLGRVGSCLLSCEESDFLGRIERAGGKLVYDPEALLWHRIPPERLQREWFLRRRYWQARSVRRMSNHRLWTSVSGLPSNMLRAARCAVGIGLRRLADRSESDAVFLRRRWYLEEAAELAERCRTIGKSLGLPIS